jgi:3-deoxy-D-manno-octulosonate 8-phosphate phosphatase (KDO 8-P phosphatase)
VGVVTARTSEAVSRRARDLGFSYVYQNRKDKEAVYEEILKESGLRPLQTAYMGDDWLDMVLLKRVGLSVAPANAVSEIQEMVHYVTTLSGGHGAVREICDLILTATGEHKKLLQQYMSR